ncbi:MAG: glyoxalase [Rhodobacteraceae bacterium]|nr:MAG: glyoxalase [Paracoccaceae bacterium]
MDNTRGFRPRALGEIAIRCADMAAMVTFYEDVIGLERMRGGHRKAITFFRIGEGFGGHTSVLALFQHPDTLQNDPVTGPGSALHHIALSLPFAEQDAVMRWYDKIDQPYRVEHFGWIGWRGIFTEDPEGNTVELVAYDAAMLDTPVE